MDDLIREKQKGFDLEYLGNVLVEREKVGSMYHTPEFGMAALLFASVALRVIEELGPERGEEILKEAVENFGKDRGRRIAEKVKALGKPLSFKNWLIYTDIDGRNFEAQPEIQDDDLVAKVKSCTFYDSACACGLGEYAMIYCKYADYAILEGYNPDIKLILEQREPGKDYCLFRYIMKEKNKERL